MEQSAHESVPLSFNQEPTSQSLPQTAASAQIQSMQTQPEAIGEQAQTAASPTLMTATSAFTTTTVEVPASLTNLTTYNAIVNKLNKLWDDQMTAVQQVTDDHWKTPDFPLARIKKVMRMDDEVKMISAEVPIMFSKAIEIFITELSLRAWLHTEEAKRRTVQRSDIAMAITKHDMFDFLIDIVPREEIQMKSKAGKVGEGEHVQLLPPDVLQLYIQHLIQQQADGGEGGGEGAGGGGGGEVGQADKAGEGQAGANTGLIQQQLNLLQQLINLQQQLQEQQQQQSTPSVGQTVHQLQHPPEPQTVPGPTAATVLETGTLQTSSQVVVEAIQQVQQATAQQPMIMAGGQVVQASHTNPAQTLLALPGGQQTLHHVDPPPHGPGTAEVQQQQTLLLTGSGGGAQSHSATIVIQPSLLGTQSQQQAGPPPILETEGGHYQLQHLDPSPHHHPQSLQMAQVQQVLMHPSQSQPTSIANHFTNQQQTSVPSVSEQIHDRFAAAGQQTSGGEEEGGLQFQNIPENESISRSISPITATLQPTSEQAAAAAAFATHQLSNVPTTTGTGGELHSNITLGTMQGSMPS